MNLYFVLSEELKEPDSWDNYEPGEWYRIVKFVSAENPSQAKYSAWKSDKSSFSYDIREIPKFECKICEKNTKFYKGNISEEYYEELFQKFEELYDYETQNYEEWQK